MTGSDAEGNGRDPLRLRDPRVSEALLRAAEKLSASASWAWDLDTGELVWSENMFRIFGFDRAAGPPRAGVTLELVHPLDRQRLQDAVAAARRGETAPEFSYRIVRGDGTVRFLHAVVSTTSLEGSRLIVGWLRDVTAVRVAQREIAAHIAVAEALAQWSESETSFRELLRNLTTALGFTRGILWVPSGPAELRPLVGWDDEDPEALRSETAGTRLRQGYGLVGRAWLYREPLAIQAISQEAGDAFRDQARQHSLQGAVAIPLTSGTEVLGVIGLAGQEHLELTDRLRATFAGIGHEIGAFLARRRVDLGRPPLSARELELLTLASDGLSGPQIAARLHLSPSTVKTHFEHIYAKYQVPDRVAAVAKALREGLIQ
jgi:PAS domain S-box-containing protein